jgi:hypothetical protein
MSPLSELGLERFEYSRVGADWAVLRVLARLEAQLGAPADAELVVSGGTERDPSRYPARACALERRLLGRGGRGTGGAGSELLWRASFAVPLEVVEWRHARFELTAPGGLALVLPSPGARLMTRRQLALAPIRRRDLQPRIAAGQVRQRFVAIATAVVVTTTSSPAVALAAGGGGSGSAGSSRQLPHPAGVSQAATGTTSTTSNPGTTSPSQSTTPPSQSTTSTATSTTPAVQSTTAAPQPTTPAPQPTTPAPQPTTPAPQPTTPAPQPTTPAPQPATPAAQATTPAVTAPAAAQGSKPTAATGSDGSAANTSKPSGRHAPARARTRAITPADLVHRSAGHTGLTHPAVTHFFSAAAHHARHRVTKPATPLPACTSKTDSAALTLAASFKPGTADPTGHAAPGTQTRCTPAPAPKAVDKREPAGKQHRRQGATFTPGGAAPGHGGSRRTFPAGAHKPGDRHPRSAGKNLTGGAPVQPLGGLTKRPGVKLGSGTSTGSVPTLSASPPGFLAPAAWTGTVSADPALTGAVTDLSGLLSNGDRPPSFLIPIYMQAGRRYGVPWEVLAAINAIESDYGRDLSTSSAGALGWMQFEPSTWREWGVAVDGHSVPNPYDPRDAIFSAARYLAAAGAGQDISKAVYAYNHAGWYVDEVLSRAQAIAGHAQFERQTVKHGSFSVYFATGFAKHPTARYSGGVMSHYDRLIGAANMVSAANFPYLYGGGHEQPALFQPFDCSGSVSYVVQQAGYKVPTTVSGEIPIWNFPSGPGRVTIFYNPTHTFMRIGNRYFGTSGFARPGGGAGWFDVNKLPAGYLAGFREVHIPRLGVNSFAPAPQHGNPNS